MPKQKYTKRNDGRYAASIVVGKLPNGNPKRKWIYATSSSELDKKITEIKMQYYRGTAVDDSITFKEWADKWFNINMPVKEKGTQKENRYLLDNHIYPAIGYLRIKDIKTFHIKDLMKNMQLNGIKTTTNKVLQLIKRILNDAIENDIIYKNVASSIKKIKFVKEEKVPLTSSEDNTLLKVAQNHSHGCFIMVMRYCGLRREEVVALEINDIDLKNKELLINKAVHFDHNQPMLKVTKSKKPRTVYIPNILIPYLENQINEQHKKNQYKYLFTKATDSNSMLTESATKRWLESFLVACKKEDKNMRFTFHQLRHSYCTMLYYANVKIKKAQELMGHASADMVYDIYTHLDEERENSKELINNYINNM